MFENFLLARRRCSRTSGESRNSRPAIRQYSDASCQRRRQKAFADFFATAITPYEKALAAG